MNIYMHCILCIRMVCICVMSSLYHRRMRSHVISSRSVYMYFSLQRGQTALMKASSEGHVECVELLDKGSSADLSDEVSAVSHQVLSV